VRGKLVVERIKQEPQLIGNRLCYQFGWQHAVRAQDLIAAYAKHLRARRRGFEEGRIDHSLERGELEWERQRPARCDRRRCRRNPRVPLRAERRPPVLKRGKLSH
jgi:hypothetical protein